MVRDELSVLAALLAVAEERSFTRAARRLEVSPSALSHAIRRLEEHIGVRLLSRTTRSVAPTDAGEQLLASLRPALGEIREALDKVGGFRERAAGRLRLLVPRLATTTVLAPKIAEFARKYPDVQLDVTTDDRMLDLVATGFDAGIHLGEFIQKDMVAVRVSKEHEPTIVGSPTYFKAHSKPRAPKDLTSHRCINFRHGRGDVYRWEFEKSRPGARGRGDGAAHRGRRHSRGAGCRRGRRPRIPVGRTGAPHIQTGALVRVLEDWCPPYPGFFLYYPSRRQQPVALTALIDTLRM